MVEEGKVVAQTGGQCPKCSAERMHSMYKGDWYRCGTVISSLGNVVEGGSCVRNQLARAQETIAQLNEHIGELNNVGGQPTAAWQAQRMEELAQERDHWRGVVEKIASFEQDLVFVSPGVALASRMLAEAEEKFDGSPVRG